MADVFVSYKREEREKVQGLVKALERLELNVWFDYDLAAGDAFGREINAQLGTAKAAIVCWSKSAVESDWVHAEADKARSLGTYASIVLEDCELPVPFNALHAADLSTWSGAMRHDGFRQLIDKLAKLTKMPLATRYAKACDEEENAAERELAKQGAVESEPEAEPETSAAPANAGSHLLERLGQVDRPGAKGVASVLAQLSFEEEILGNPRTKWIVADGERQAISAPAHATMLNSLREALEQADDGDCIVILPGVHRGRFNVDKNVRLVGFGNKDERAVLSGDDQNVVVELDGAPRLENLVIESRYPGHALRICVDAIPTIVRCVIERQQIAKDHKAALHVSGGANPTFLASTIWGGYCPAIHFAGTAAGRFASTDVFASEAEAIVVQGGCKPRFDRCAISATNGHAVVNKTNASALFESCSLKATGFSTVVNFEGAYSRFVANRMTVRSGSLIEIKASGFGRFERNRLEPDPDRVAQLTAQERERKKLFPNKALLKQIPPPIAVASHHKARFVQNVLPDGTEAKPVVASYLN
jgi:hypothetical protein